MKPQIEKIGRLSLALMFYFLGLSIVMKPDPNAGGVLFFFLFVFSLGLGSYHTIKFIELYFPWTASLPSSKIVFAPRDQIDMYAPELDKILNQLGYSPHEVLITNESTFGDFITSSINDIDRSDVNKLNAVQAALHLSKLKFSTKLIDAAKEMRGA